MGKMREFADWVKRKFGKEDTRTQTPQPGKIIIIRRNDADVQPSRPSNGGGRITIGAIHSNPAPTFGGFRPEVPVDNPDLSGGIHVARRRKPGTCPMCRSKGTVIDNPGGRPKWKCSACEYTFN